MARPIPKFTDRERQLVSQSIFERCGNVVPLETAESELQLNLLKDDLTPCPTLTWDEQGARFVIFKTGDSRFRCQFYYTEVEQFNTGKDEYDSLGDCVITLLQVQANYERERQSIRSGMNAVDFSKANDGDEYFAPIII
jgi:hypothetical protein